MRPIPREWNSSVHVDVADLGDDVPHERVELSAVESPVRGDLAREDDFAPLAEDLARHVRAGVARQVRVEDAVGDVVADLVGVALGDGLGSQKEVEALGAHQQRPFA